MNAPGSLTGNVAVLAAATGPFVAFAGEPFGGIAISVSAVAVAVYAVSLEVRWSD